MAKDQRGTTRNERKGEPSQLELRLTQGVAVMFCILGHFFDVGRANSDLARAFQGAGGAGAVGPGTGVFRYLKTGWSGEKTAGGEAR